MPSQRFQGSNINIVRSHNIQAVLMSLLHKGQISRAGLAKQTSLSSPTITNLTSELLKAGIIKQASPKRVNTKRRVGRPRTMLKLVPTARYAIGVHIGVGLLRVAITDLYARIVNNKIIEYNVEIPAEAVLNQIVAAIGDVIRESSIDTKHILGIGVGASGLVNPEMGLNVLAPRLGWKNIDIRQRLETELNYPVSVDNNVRAMAVGEAFFGAGKGVNVLAFVYGRIGVGAGFVINGEVYRGSGAGAGEIGHTIIRPDAEQPCRCGKKGCLETLVSELVIIKHAKEIAKQHPQSLMAQYFDDQDSNQSPIEKIFAAANEGDEHIKTMISEQMHYLGIALANLVNILNPEMILLGGMFSQGDALIRPVVQKCMRKTAFDGLAENVILQPTSFSWRAGVIGAASLALLDFFYKQSEI